MPYTEEQKDKILLNLEKEKKKVSGKGIGRTGKFFGNRFKGWIILPFVSHGLILEFERMKDKSKSFKSLGIGLVLILIGFIIYAIGLGKGELKKGKLIEKPEGERKTGRGQFGNYFICQICKEEFRVSMETKRETCRDCGNNRSNNNQNNSKTNNQKSEVFTCSKCNRIYKLDMKGENGKCKNC